MACASLIMTENTDNRAGILKVNVNLSKVDKTALFKGAKGVYLDLAIHLHRSEDQYGHHCMATQDLGKDRREAGEQGAILGNGKFVIKPPADADWVEQGGKVSKLKPEPNTIELDPDDDDDLPF